jgi:hypothetical protein
MRCSIAFREDSSSGTVVEHPSLHLNSEGSCPGAAVGTEREKMLKNPNTVCLRGDDTKLWQDNNNFSRKKSFITLFLWGVIFLTLHFHQN